MRVGISVLTRQGQSLWENGIGQNALALAMLMQEPVSYTHLTLPTKA